MADKFSNSGRFTSRVSVKGYEDLIRTINYIGGDFKREMKAELRKVGENTRRDAAKKSYKKGFSRRTVTGFRTIVRQRGIAVEQSRRKTTGAQPKFGGVQMTRALIPARDGNVKEAAKNLDKVLNTLVRRAG